MWHKFCEMHQMKRFYILYQNTKTDLLIELIIAVIF